MEPCLRMAVESNAESITFFCRKEICGKPLTMATPIHALDGSKSYSTHNSIEVC